MDQKLLAALNNLSIALQNIADSLEQKDDKTSNSAVADTLKSGNFIEQIKSINLGVIELQKDSKKILKNQETIIELSKNKDKKSSIFEESGDRNKKELIKSGVGTVLLIATGVLAIGAAFKLIGQVNFASVLALSIALPLIAKSFEIISQMKSLTGGDILKLSMIIIGMSATLVASSYILSYTKSVNAYQLVTIIGIASAFAGISYGISKLTDGLKNVNLKSVIFMPLVLISMSLAIAGSSYILSGVRPVGLYQLTTAVGIALVFSAISYGIKNIAEGIKNVDLKTIAMAPIVLITMAAAITGASLILSYVQPVGLFQLFTAIGIAATFVVVSYGLNKLVSSLKDVDLKTVLLMPLVLITMSLAITGSSYILNSVQVIPINTLINIALQAAALSIIGIALGFSFMLLGKMGLSNIVQGGVAILAIATTVMLASLILSVGSYEKYPGMDWILNIGISFLAFGIGAALLGNFLVNIAIGSVAILLIAGTILATDKILSFGDYKLYPNDNWIKGVGLTMLGFGAAAAILGLMLPLVVIGGVAILMLAGTILAVDAILSSGEFTKFPSLDYAQGVSNSLVAFGSTLGNIGLSGILLNAIGSLFGTGPVDLAKQIVEVNRIFTGNEFVKYPSNDWAIGVAKTLTAFAGIASDSSLGGIILSSIGKLFGTGPVDIAEQIVAVDKALSKGNYIKYPPKEWVESVVAFSQIGKAFETISNLNIDNKKIDTNITKIANSYDKLNASLRNLNSTINTLDLEKITAIKNLTGSIVLMSLMDPTQFKLMMNALDNKSKILGNVANDLTGEKNAQNRTVQTLNVKTPNTKNEKEATLTDIYNILSLIRNESSGANNSLKTLVREIRNDDNNKLKKN